MRSDILRSLDRGLVSIVAAALLLAVVELSLLPLDQPGGWVLPGIPLMFLVYIFAGVIAWQRRPSNRMGFLIVYAGFAVFLGGIVNTGVPALVAIGAIFATLALPAIIQLLLAFPTGRFSTRPARILVGASYFLTIVLQAPRYLLDPNGPFPPFAIADEPDLLNTLRIAQGVGGAVVMIGVAVILATRLVRADRAHRRVLAPVFLYGIATVLFIPLSTLVFNGLLGMPSDVRGGLQFVVVTGVPIAFALGTLYGGFARTGQLEELGSWLAADADRAESLQAAMARALGDPTVRLYFRATEGDDFVDEEGRIVVHDPADPRRGWVEILLDGRTIGAVAYDAALIDDREKVRSAGSVVAIAIDRQRLTADLLSSQRALTRSRERIIDASDRERRRIARNLHDGLQVRLVMLALEAQQLSKIPGNPPTTSTRAIRLRADIDEAAAEVRRLVHDVVPAALIERGLGATAEDLAGRMPILTTVQISGMGGRLPQAIETAAYFVIAECLTNIVKHARASSAHLGLDVSGDMLRISVSDNGRGGADSTKGTGLLGLADRVDVMGGTMRVRSEEGTGTELTVELPCA